MKQTPVVIIGISEQAQLAAEILHQQQVAIYGYLAVEVPDGVTELNNIPLLGAFNEKNYHKMLKGDKVDYCIIEPSIPERPHLLKELYEIANRYPINIIHQSVFIATDIDLASGNLIEAYSVFGIHVVIGTSNLIGAQVTIDSGTKIGNYCTIQSGVRIGLNAQIEDSVYIGAGAVIAAGIKVGTGAVVGAGAVVLRTVPEGATVFGNPARIIEN